MKVFVWEDISNLTDNYHSDGGLIVFAETVERAIEMAIEQGVTFHESELTADDVRIVGGGEEKVYIMPNAGCC
jgi:hypothetical protein